LTLSHRIAVREFGRYGDVGKGGPVAGIVFPFLGGTSILYFPPKAISFPIEDAKEQINGDCPYLL
jgi:hypothetical protein